MKARLTAAFSLALIPLAALAGCGGGGGGGSSAATAAGSGSGASAGGGGQAAVKVAQNSTLGSILVDRRGRTLYTFQKDTANRSNCSGKCAQFWPPLIAHGKPRGGKGVNVGMLGTTKRSDGSMQVTFGGHPLYTFIRDTAPGDVNGNGLNQFGAIWNAVQPSGAMAKSGASTSSTGGGSSSTAGGGGSSSSSSSGGYGY